MSIQFVLLLILCTTCLSFSATEAKSMTHIGVLKVQDKCTDIFKEVIVPKIQIAANNGLDFVNISKPEIVDIMSRILPKMPKIDANDGFDISKSEIVDMSRIVEVISKTLIKTIQLHGYTVEQYELANCDICNFLTIKWADAK